MANRFPLIVNTAANQIQELAAGDNLDLSSSNISNVGNVTVASAVTVGTTLNATTSVTSPRVNTQTIGYSGVSAALYIDGAGNVDTAYGLSIGKTYPGGNLDIYGSKNLNFQTGGTILGNAGNITITNLTSGNVIVTPVGNTIMNGTTKVGNLTTTKYNETVIAGGSTGAVTLTPDVATGTIFNYTLTGNITINALGNSVAGSGATLILTQDGTGNRTLTSTMKFSGGQKTLSTAAGAIDIMSVFYDGTTYYASLGKGFA
jgi:hypothetical protein